MYSGIKRWSCCHIINTNEKQSRNIPQQIIQKITREDTDTELHIKNFNRLH